LIVNQISFRDNYGCHHYNLYEHALRIKAMTLNTISQVLCLPDRINDWRQPCI